MQSADKTTMSTYFMDIRKIVWVCVCVCVSVSVWVCGVLDRTETEKAIEKREKARPSR